MAKQLIPHQAPGAQFSLQTERKRQVFPGIPSYIKINPYDHFIIASLGHVPFQNYHLLVKHGFIEDQTRASLFLICKCVYIYIYICIYTLVFSLQFDDFLLNTRSLTRISYSYSYCYV